MLIVLAHVPETDAKHEDRNGDHFTSKTSLSCPLYVVSEQYLLGSHWEKKIIIIIIMLTTYETPSLLYRKRSYYYIIILFYSRTSFTEQSHDADNKKSSMEFSHQSTLHTSFLCSLNVLTGFCRTIGAILALCYYT